MFSVAAALAVLMLHSCATIGSLEPPRISLAGLQVETFNGLEAAMQVDLRVYNRSQQPLTVQGIDLELALNDRHLAQGVAASDKQIPAYGSDILTVKLYASMLDMAGALHRLIQQSRQINPQETLRYTVSGHVRVQTTGMPTKVPFTTRGEIDWKNLTTADGM
jgi:LEA14-like dessication related protein